MTQEERRAALKNVDPSNYGIYDAEVKLFLQYFEDMERVKELGGLHVIGSERHEARRIDNQLRGRAARQGDPGSSRFYLSLQDDLMRLQGGSQVSNLMERLRVDDSLPLEVRLVGNIIEQSQHRIEGANFDVRKHLLEYDDVLNQQRAQIYGQRDRIFVKEDLSDDIAGNAGRGSGAARRNRTGRRGRSVEVDRLARTGPAAVHERRPALPQLWLVSASQGAESMHPRILQPVHAWT